MSSVDETLERVQSELWHERTSAALELLDGLGAPEHLSGEHVWRAKYLGIRCASASGAAVDRLVLDARAALEHAQTSEHRALLHREIAYHLSRKRCDALATAAANDAIAAVPGSTIGHDALGAVHLAFDRRREALTVFESALALDEGWRATLGVARSAYVMGDFDRTLAVLGDLSDHPRTRTFVARYRAAIFHVRGEWERYLVEMDTILAHTERGVHYRDDQLNRASALFRLERKAEAIETYRSVWRADETDGPGRFARAVLDHIERQAPGRRVMLPAFPTTTQRWNYCGPAVLELVLRYLGVHVDQDTIAGTVKLPDGSPMVRLASYLESHDLESRRFEATPERLRVCLDHGLPVIVEEEYSTTTHVAVVIGIDEPLGLLLVQDPMTHVTSERLIRTQSRLGQLFRQAALVALRRDDHDLRRVLDDGDVKDTAHIRLLDRCGEEDVRHDPTEVIRLCTQAIHDCDDYLLAWMRRAWEHFYLARRHDSRANLDRFLSALREVRVRYGAQERPHQLHGEYLMWQSRWEEALIEMEDALRLDPGDANNAQCIAECHEMCRREDEAAAAYWNALKLDPAHIRATENFAALALRMGDERLAGHLSSCAQELAPTNPFNHITASKVAVRQGRRDDAIAAARRALEIDANWHEATMHLASVLRGDPSTSAEALHHYEGLVDRYPQWFAPRLEAADLIAAAGRVDDAVELLRSGIGPARDEPADLLRKAVELLVRAERAKDAVAFAREQIEARATLPMKLELLQLYRDQEMDTEGVALAREVGAEFPDAASAQAELGWWLVDTDARADGEKALERALDLAPSFWWARGRLVAHLRLDRPDAALAATLPGEDIDDPWLMRDRASVLSDLGRTDDALAVLRRIGRDDRMRTFGFHEQYTRARVGSRPRGVARDELLVATADANDFAEHDARALLALALTMKDADAVDTALGRVTPHDSATLEILVRATDDDGRWRDRLETLLASAVDAKEATDDQRAWFRAVLAGSRAASGDTVALDAALDDARQLKSWFWMLRSLDEQRDLALIRRVRDKIVVLEPESSSGWMERVHMASMDGHRDRAIALIREGQQRWPRNHAFSEYLAIELLLDGADEGHHWADHTMAMTTRCYYSHEIAALSWLLRGDRDRAKGLATSAATLMLPSGLDVHTRTVGGAVLAVLAGDRDALERHAKTAHLHARPGAPVWTRLRSMITA